MENKLGKPATKTAMFAELSAATQMTKKQVTVVFDELGKLIKKELGKKGPGVVTLPGLAQDQARPQARHQGPPGPQPADRRADDDQGQAEPAPSSRLCPSRASRKWSSKSRPAPDAFTVKQGRGNLAPASFFDPSRFSRDALADREDRAPPARRG